MSQANQVYSEGTRNVILISTILQVILNKGIRSVYIQLLPEYDLKFDKYLGVNVSE
jgi:hypothetical protein